MALPPVSAVTLITGAAGSGKTLRAVSLLEELIGLFPYRPSFAVGIDGYRGSAQVLPVHGFDWRRLPDGAVCVVDEAHKIYKQGKQREDTPEQISDMREIRHRGIVLIMTSQSAMDLHHGVRRICGYHEHIYAVMGGRSRIASGPEFKAERTADDMQDDISGWKLPSGHFDLYDSATAHTVVRRRLPPGLARHLMPLAKPLIFMLAIGIFAFVFVNRFSGVSSSSSEVKPGPEVAAVPDKGLPVPAAATGAVDGVDQDIEILTDQILPFRDITVGIGDNRRSVPDRIIGYGLRHSDYSYRCLLLSGVWIDDARCFGFVDRDGALEFISARVDD